MHSAIGKLFLRSVPLERNKYFCVQCRWKSYFYDHEQSRCALFHSLPLSSFPTSSSTVTPLSHHCHTYVTPLSHFCHTYVTLLSHLCHTTVTPLSHLSHLCHISVTPLFPTLFQARGMTLLWRSLCTNFFQGKSFNALSLLTARSLAQKSS